MKKIFYTLLLISCAALMNMQSNAQIPGCDSLIATTQMVSGLPNGSYKVVVTNSTGCSKTDYANVTTNNNLSIVTHLVSANGCNTSNGGSVSVAPTGGSNFSYLWSNGQTTSVISGLANGTYTVTVTNNSNCSQTASIDVVTNNNLSIVTNLVSANACNTTNAGSVSVAPTGGSGFSYLWSNGQTTSVISGLANGTYTVTVTNNSNCSQTASINVVTNNNLSLVTHLVSANACNTTNAGSVSVAPTGGSGFSYLWSNGQTGSVISGLANGTYTVTVTNNSNCNQTASVAVVTNNNLNLVTQLVTANPCNAPSAGSASVTATGGSGFSYLWSNSKNTAFISGLANGTYTVTVTNNSNCTQTASVTVVTNNNLNLVTQLVTANPCNAPSAGSASVTATGGSGFTYLWSNGKNTAFISGLANGTYTVTVTNSSNCNKTATVQVSTYNNLVLDAHPVSTNGCNTTNAGLLTVTATGGSGFTYQWYKITGATQPVITANVNTLTSSTAVSYQWYLNGLPISGANSQTYTALVTGDYTVETTNGGGCTAISAPATVSVISGIKETASGSLKIYPNPASDVLHIRWADRLAAEEMSVEVYNLAGQLVLKEIGNNNINVSQLTGGSYLIRVLADGYQYNSTFVKQ